MSHATLVSVGGGKGGAGKSLVAANLGVALAQHGMRVVLVDADLGSPNLHTLLGVGGLGPTLQGLLDRRIASLEEAVIATSIPRVSLVPGASGRLGAANPSHAEKQKLLRHVRALDADVVVVDVGAGTAFNTLDLFSLADLRFVVVTPELTSLQNAYCFVKCALLRELAVLAKELGAAEAWVEASERKETARLGTSLERLAVQRPDVARAFRAHLARFGARLVGNLAGASSERHTVFALARMCREFLDIDTPVSAMIPMSNAMRVSVMARVPVLTTPGVEPALVRAFEALSEQVLTFDVGARRAARVEEPATEQVVLPAEPGFVDEIARVTRREERIEVNFASAVRYGAGLVAESTVFDLSPRGARLGPLPGAQGGDRVAITIVHRGGMIVLDGVVRHATERATGVELDAACAPLTEALIAAVRMTATPERA